MKAKNKTRNLKAKRGDIKRDGKNKTVRADKKNARTNWRGSFFKSRIV